MSEEVAVLVMSHGDLARAAVQSAELIVGKQENYDCLSVFLVDEIESLKEEMLAKVDQLDTSKGLVIVCDVIGGTPMNLSGHLIDREHTMVVSGLNLPILLELFMNRDKSIGELHELIQGAYQTGFVIREGITLKEEDEDDSL